MGRGRERTVPNGSTNEKCPLSVPGVIPIAHSYLAEWTDKTLKPLSTTETI